MISLILYVFTPITHKLLVFMEGVWFYKSLPGQEFVFFFQMFVHEFLKEWNMFQIFSCHLIKYLFLEVINILI